MLPAGARVAGWAAAASSSSASRPCSTRCWCMDSAVSTSTMAGSRARSSMRAAGGRCRPRPPAVGDRGGVSARLLSSLAFALLLRLMPDVVLLLLQALATGLQRPRRPRANILAALMPAASRPSAAAAAAACTRCLGATAPISARLWWAAQRAQAARGRRRQRGWAQGLRGPRCEARDFPGVLNAWIEMYLRGAPNSPNGWAYL